MGNACGQMMRNHQNRCHFDDLETVSHEFVNTMLYVYAVSPELCVDTFLHFLGRPAYLSPLSPETYKVLLLKDPVRILPKNTISRSQTHSTGPPLPISSFERWIRGSYRTPCLPGWTDAC